jgi:ubiquinone/menaquinone biosynthesis C-methylase UbiE
MMKQIARYCLALVPLSLTTALAAQEASVRPGVNDRFRDPQSDPQTFVSMFETESREIFRHRHDIVAALDLEPGMTVADVGAGTGLFTLLFAERLTAGKVLAVDISQQLLDYIAEKARGAKIANVTPILGTDSSIQLEPDSVDLVFVCDTYHHFEYPVLILESIHAALRAEGRLVIIDFERVQGVSSQFALDHVRAGKGTVTDEIKDAGFELAQEVPLMKEQYFLAFRKRP